MRAFGLTLLPTAAFFVSVWVAAAAGLVNINTADAKLLDTLPGIGPTKAAAIVSYRTAHGDFAKTADIQKVSGIGPVTYAKFESMITVGAASSTEAQTAAAAPTKPKVTAPSLHKRQAVEPIINQISNVPHEEAGMAPAAATELASAGAPLPEPSPTSRIFHSPWTLTFIGVVVAASGAFIFL